METEFKWNVGDKIPFFQLQDDRGGLFSTDELYGCPSILYFYPKDDTEGCTAEACAFRDALERFNDVRVPVIGISPDTVESHQAFKKKYDLNFPLLSDVDHKVAEEFGLWKEKSMYGKKYFGVLRTTYLIDASGVIRWIERPVKVEGHVERILRDLRKFTDLMPQE